MKYSLSRIQQLLHIGSVLIQFNGVPLLLFSDQVLPCKLKVLPWQLKVLHLEGIMVPAVASPVVSSDSESLLKIQQAGPGQKSSPSRPAPAATSPKPGGSAKKQSPKPSPSAKRASPKPPTSAMKVQPPRMKAMKAMKGMMKAIKATKPAPPAPAPPVRKRPATSLREPRAAKHKPLGCLALSEKFTITDAAAVGDRPLVDRSCTCGGL